MTDSSWDWLFFSGVILLLVGAYLIHPAAVLVVLGLALAGGAVLGSKAWARRKEPEKKAENK